MNRRRFALAALVAAAALSVSACASTAGGTPAGGAADAPPGFSLGSLTPGLPTGDVIAQGLALDMKGDVELCLGAVAESAPPQCSGLPLAGWTWEGVDGSTEYGDGRWGSYAVQGTWDGTTFTVTQPPIMLALYDPMRPTDPTDGKPGTADLATLEEIQEALPGRLGSAYLGSVPEQGRLWVDVLWDDGTWQKAADDDFGAGVVIIRSAMHVIG